MDRKELAVVGVPLFILIIVGAYLWWTQRSQPAATPKAPATVSTAPASQPPQRTGAEQEAKATAPEGPSTWTDPTTGLTWMGHDNGKDVSYNEARDYCTQLAPGDFMLSSIDELFYLFDSSQDRNQSSTVHIRGPIVLGNIMVWSLTNLTDLMSRDYIPGLSPEVRELKILFWFGEGIWIPVAPDTKGRALCVRRNEQWTKRYEEGHRVKDIMMHCKYMNQRCN